MAALCTSMGQASTLSLSCTGKGSSSGISRTWKLPGNALFRSPPRAAVAGNHAGTVSSIIGGDHLLGPSASGTFMRGAIPLRIKPLVSSRALKRPQLAPSASLSTALDTGVQVLADAASIHPATWQSSVLIVATIFVVGSPVLLAGLSPSALLSAFLLGLATWRAFSGPGFAVVGTYFILGSLATKVRLKQKEAEGIAEARGGRRGPGSVWGSGLAGIICALLQVLSEPGGALGGGAAPGVTADTLVPAGILALGFAASFSTKLSDTAASEIGKAFGRSTYLVTTLQRVPRGTEGAVSLEGTLAGLLGACLLAAVALATHLVDGRGWLLCVLASQVANYGESLLGATLQSKEGFKWMTNDVVNMFNISAGALLAMGLAAAAP